MFFESGVKAVLETLGDVFGGAGETPSVLGVVCREEGCSHHGEPCVVFFAVVFDA